MSVREYLIYCTYCNEYSTLGKYLEGDGQFEGEYSLAHNRRILGNELLCLFLLKHLGHHIKTYPDRTDEFSDILKHGVRFMDEEVDKFMEQEQSRRKKNDDELLMERGLGQLQLNVLQKIIEDEARTIAKIPTSSPAEGQFLLGKEEGLKHALEILDDLLKRTNLLYRKIEIP
jgi:hypothetical protein